MIDDSNDSRWMAAADDAAPWWQIDLGAAHDIVGAEAYFVKPAASHAYKLEAPLDGKAWTPYGGQPDVVRRSLRVDRKPARVRDLRSRSSKASPGCGSFACIEPSEPQADQVSGRRQLFPKGTFGRDGKKRGKVGPVCDRTRGPSETGPTGEAA